jgi:hypothetical protein
LTCREAAAVVATTDEQEIARLPAVQSEILVDGLTGLLGELEPDRTMALTYFAPGAWRRALAEPKIRTPAEAAERVYESGRLSSNISTYVHPSEADRQRR